MEGENKELKELKERISKTLEERYQSWPNPVEEVVQMEKYLSLCADHDYPSEGSKEEEKDLLDPIIYKGICNKLCKIQIIVKEEVIVEIMKTFNTILKIINAEISSGRCNLEIIEASEVIFKINESFFRTNRVDAPKKKKKGDKEAEEKKKEEEDKEKESPEKTGDSPEKTGDSLEKTDDNPEKTGDNKSWGHQDAGSNINNEDITGWNNDDPEIAGQDKAIGSQNEDLMAAEDTNPVEPEPTEDAGDMDTEELDKTGNQADDEDNDQSKYFEEEIFDQETNFTPDQEYHYEYDEDIQ